MKILHTFLFHASDMRIISPNTISKRTTLCGILFFISVVFLISFSGCNLNEVADDTPDDTVDISSLTINNFPRVDGSSSTHPLIRTIACEMFKVEYTWLEQFDGTMNVYPLDDSSKTDVVEFIGGIRHNGTHRAYVNLIKDSTDLILVAREPSADEQTAADSAGVQFSIAPIALDALVIILNSTNPVNELSSDEIVNIYSGFITNWKEVGGKDERINPYMRNRNSGSQELMEKLVMKGRTMIDAPEMITNTMMGHLNRIENDAAGIGYTVYFYNTTMVPKPAIKMISVDNVYPSSSTIGIRSYPFTSPVYAVIRSNTSASSNTYLFWKWLKTAEAQRIVAKSKYVPISINQGKK